MPLLVALYFCFLNPQTHTQSPKQAETQAKKRTSTSTANALASFPSMKYQSLMTARCSTSDVITATRLTKVVTPESVSASGKSSTSNSMNIKNRTYHFGAVRTSLKSLK